jgi:ribosome assembly protein YihI (activator of Der GTPase)
MTRQKKTRSAGPNGLRNLSAEDARKTRQPKEQSKKKGAGLKSGSRNSMPADSQNKANTAAKKDPRLGSKKPIELTPAAQPTPAQQTEQILQPKASLGKVKPVTLTAEQELAIIENDSYLQQLLERVEKDEILTGKDAKYFNTKTARLEQLLEELGLGDDETSDDPLSAFERIDWRKDLLGDED